MGIMERFKDIMAANINALLDKAEDPEKMIDQYMRNLQSDLGKVKAETASVIAEESRAKRALDECNANITKMQTYAEKAVAAGNDTDARQFRFFRIGMLPKQFFLIPGTDGDKIIARISIIKAFQPVLFSFRQFHFFTPIFLHQPWCEFARLWLEL